MQEQQHSPDNSSSNADLITRFYEAFAAQDAAAMTACYHADAKFSDPAFGDLTGSEIGAMWAMLVEPHTRISTVMV